jgi:hypothetical protein
MAIATAVQRGNYVYVYDDKGPATARIAGGGAARKMAYRATQVQPSASGEAPTYITYDEKGRQLSAMGVR